jgi:MFS family permease
VSNPVAPPPTPRRSLTSYPAFRALRHSEFKRFFWGGLLAQLGFWFSHISFQHLMSQLTDDELWVSMLFVVTFGPVLLVGPFGGMVVDRFDRKKVLLGCYGALIVTVSVRLPSS